MEDSEYSINDRSGEMKNGAKYYKPGENQDTPRPANISMDKAVLGAPGSDVVGGGASKVNSGTPKTSSGGGGY